ncbi:MAG: hypothetical protein M3Y08_08950, partial [Fibrobacterota bacterium]|nr:hypothetical protein [Fibrobacterota bacterium]
MLNAADLSKLAIKSCLEHARKRVMGDLTITATGSHSEWNEHQMRHVHSQAMTIWRRYGQLDIIMNEKGKLVGFIDHAKYQDAGDEALSREEAMAMISKAGVVPSSARLEEFKQVELTKVKGTVWKAVFALEVPAKDYALLDVEINGTKK